MKEQVESQVAKSLQGSTKPRQDSEAKGIRGGFSARCAQAAQGGEWWVGPRNWLEPQSLIYWTCLLGPVTGG